MASKTTVPENLTREQYIFMAKLAQQSERYDEMLICMQNVVTITPPSTELTVEERNLHYAAYKKVVGSLRTSWRVVSSIEQKEKSRKNEVVKEYRCKVEKELTDICYEILNALESNLVASASSSESKVFYLKMKGDYSRYLAEVKTGDERKQVVEAAMNSYKAAQDIARADLGPAHPIRLGLALNFSVFCYEILNSFEKACGMAEQAFEEADAQLDTLGEDLYKDSSLIMQLLRDNFALWTQESATCVS